MRLRPGIGGMLQLRRACLRRRGVRSNLRTRAKRYHPRLLLTLTFVRGRIFAPKFVKARHFLLARSRNRFRNGLHRALHEGKGLTEMYRGRRPY